MKKFFILSWLAVTLAGCTTNSSSDNSYNYYQPTTYTTSCSYCNGAGILLNPYDGNYYYCSGCNGTGSVTVQGSGNNPSFQGGGKACTAIVGCDCSGFQKKAAYGSDEFVCRKCHHLKQYHHKGDL